MCRFSPGYKYHNPDTNIKYHLVCSSLTITISDCCVQMGGIPATHVKMNCSHYIHRNYCFEKNDDCRCCCLLDNEGISST